MQKVPNLGTTDPQKDVWEEKYKPLPVQRSSSECVMPKAVEKD